MRKRIIVNQENAQTDKNNAHEDNRPQKEGPGEMVPPGILKGDGAIFGARKTLLGTVSLDGPFSRQADGLRLPATFVDQIRSGS